ncbi:MAG: hypothetical protein KAJ91_02330 [Candidatus Aenigmarchaeota archaeon]|nr:hypothetical protein [Candidatus Aenigmarchaeota archaeon]
MSATPLILIAIAVLILLFAVVALWSRKTHKRPTDYYNLFIIGIIWLPIGIATGNSTLWILGLVFLIAERVHKKDWEKNRVRWSDLTPDEKKFREILFVALAILLLVGVVVFYVARASS